MNLDAVRSPLSSVFRSRYITHRFSHLVLVEIHRSRVKPPTKSEIFCLICIYIVKADKLIT